MFHGLKKEKLNQKTKLSQTVQYVSVSGFTDLKNKTKQLALSKIKYDTVALCPEYGYLNEFISWNYEKVMDLCATIECVKICSKIID
jgi:hypothetical protein